VVTSLETQGEVMQAALRVLVWANISCAVAWWWSPRSALVGALTLGLLIIPYQLVLLDRLTRLNTEVMRLADARLRLQAQGKPAPLTLNDRELSNPRLRKWIDYQVDENGRDFVFYYFVVDRGISHSYDSKTGWFYYPD
jgi:hypothetical protein